jgi:pimeloyl-ACP methyl ester carboxylesterase
MATVVETAEFGRVAVVVETRRRSLSPGQQMAMEQRQREECCACCGRQARAFTNSLQEPRGFLAFNLVCLSLTVPALTYYISFFKKGWFLPNTAGMTAVWGNTIGAIATAILTSGVGPPLPKFVSRSFCVAVICWEYLCSVSCFIACVSLAYMNDFHGFGWAFVASLATGCGGAYLTWFALFYARPPAIEHAPIDAGDVPLPSPDAAHDAHLLPPPPPGAMRSGTVSSKDIYTMAGEPMPPHAPYPGGGDVEMQRMPYHDDIPSAPGYHDPTSPLSMALDRLTTKPNLSMTAETIAMSPGNSPHARGSGLGAQDAWRLTYPADDDEFTCHTDAVTGRTYYHNKRTGVSQWHSPESERGLPPGYLSHVDEATGRVYYANEKLGITTWERPEMPATLPPPAPPMHEERKTESVGVHLHGPLYADTVAQGPSSPDEGDADEAPPAKQPPPSKCCGRGSSGGGERGDCCPPDCAGGAMAVLFIAIQCLLWIILFVFAVIPFGFGVQSAMQAAETVMYPAPGRLFAVSTSLGFSLVTSVSPAVPTTFTMHISCQGPGLNQYQRPTILLEADNYTSGYALVGLQSALVDSSKGWRVCWYDRAGYGWSQQPPLGSSTPDVTAARLNTLLAQSGETANARGFILVGHGAGGELVQIYANRYPSQVRGVALLDGYSSVDRLRQVANDATFQSTAAICSTLEIGRALESVVLMRAVTNQFTSMLGASKNLFTPDILLPYYLSTQTNGRYWSAQYSDLCVNKGSATQNTDYLTSLCVGRKTNTLGGASWPQLTRNTPVLIVTASNSLTAFSVLATQARLYNATLSPTNTTRWVNCRGCDRSFAFDSNTAWVANQIHQYFYSFTY